MWAALLLQACGAGTAGIVSGASGSGSGGGAAPAITSFTVPSPKVSPAAFILQASAGVEAELFYAIAGGPDLAMRVLPGPGVSGNRVQLDAGVNTLAWDFAADLGAGLTRNVTLRAKRGATLVEGGELAIGGMGNDAPVVLLVEPLPSDPSDPDESSGIVELRIITSDSSRDLVDLTVEWRRAGGPSDAWNPATFAGAPPGGVETSEVGREHSFFWNTNVDLADDEDAVFFRVRADDRTDVGPPLETQVAFRIDNNEEPIVQLDSGPLVSNPDERRGIPVPFRVIDEEGDLVEVIFQWRREGEAFPPLPTDMGELDAVLADPELRREHHVCTPYRRFARGRVIPVDGTHVRLPELAASENWILASGLEGRTLELMRHSTIPEPITPTWARNPLVSPVTALPLGDGLTALVLDAPGGNGRLREIELATGEPDKARAEIARLPGMPTAMIFERGSEEAVLVASDLGTAWRLERIELSNGAVTELYTSKSGDEPPPLRGLASLGTRALLLTAGSSLLHLDYQDRHSPRIATLLSDLATPWGVLVDPLSTNRVYIAEHDADRVLSVDLATRQALPTVVSMAGLGQVERPRSLALEQRGARLLAVTSPAGGSWLVGLELGAGGGHLAFPVGVPRASEIASIATGPDGLRLAAEPLTHELLVGGGLEQRRTIVAYEPFDVDRRTGQEVTLDAALLPEARPGQAWRVPTEFGWIQADAGGTAASYPWSADVDVPAGGRLLLRAFSRDGDIGPSAGGSAPKKLRSELDVEPVVLGGFGATDAPFSVAAADLDGDGDIDLVTANSSSLTVFFQTSPGTFADPPFVLGGPGTTINPRSVVAADLDGDRDMDIVTANSDALTVFFQVSPGSFTSSPLVLGGPGIAEFPRSVAAADLDGDGDVDLVAANSNNLTVFFQTSPGTFAGPPLVLGGPGTAEFPRSVAAADLDGDGDVDLVSANSGTLTVFFQSSPGTFASPPLVLGSPGTTGAPVSLAAADLDGDGDIDLVSANAGSDNLTVFFQSSPGTFAGPPLVLGGPGTTEVPQSVVAADLDGDGDNDLVSANWLSNSLTVFFQISPGGFAGPLALGGPGTTGFPQSVAAADLDGDGDVDLVSANLASTSKLTLFSQTAPGSFASPLLALGGPGTTDSPRSVAAADLDGDGDVDLVSANGGGDNLTVFFQTSPGGFAGPPLALGGPGTTDFPFSLAAADLDGDGDVDLVSANAGSDDLTVFLQTSPGSFAGPPLVLGGPGTTDGPVSLAAADVDGDGDVDLVSANYGDFEHVSTRGDNLTVFFQTSPGSFAGPPLHLGGPETTNAPGSLALADLDGDGDIDIVSGNERSNNLVVFFQTSPGSFASPPLSLDGSGTMEFPPPVVAADLDGDGDVDLVSADSSHVTVFIQTSPGQFASPAHLPSGFPATIQPFSLAGADLDGDGEIDLVSANANDTLTVLWGGH